MARLLSLLSFLARAKTVSTLFRDQTLQQREIAMRLGPGGNARPASETDKSGRDAVAPYEIPPRGVWQVAKRTATKFSQNKLMNEAAGVTFYALLSLFPALTAVVSIYGLFADPRTISGHLEMLAGFIPSGGMDIIGDQVKRLTAAPTAGLTSGAIGGLLAALWSANQGAKGMISALNDVYGEEEERGFIRLTLTSLAFTVGALLAILIAIGLIVVLPIVFQIIGLGSATDIVGRVARIPVVLLAIMAALAVLYRFGPSRRQAKWRWVTWGGAVGATAWVVLSIAFSSYVEHFGNYNKTYGSLGALIGFMTWIWLSTTVLLLGAQINAELEAQTAQDTTTGRTRPVGSRGAAAADVVS